MEECVTSVRKLNERTYAFEQFDVRFYLLLGKEKALLTDTGFSCFNDLKEKVSSITNLPLMVMNSHGHPDHCGGNFNFDFINAHLDGFRAIYRFQTGRPVLRSVANKEIIELGERTIETVYTPGHIDGHLALLDRTERILLPGDILQDEHLVMYLGYGADPAVYRESLLMLKNMGSVYDTILPSHGALPMGKEQFDVVLACVDAYLAGELEGTDAIGPDGTACKEYRKGSFAILV